MDDGKTFHIAAGGPLQVPCSLMIIEVSEVDWEKETADVKLVEEILIVPKSDYVFKLPEEVDGGQNVGFFTPMITMAQTQLHAPTLVGNFKRDGHLNGLRWVYWNVYSDDRILLIDPRTNKKTNTFAFPGVSDQLHGIWTNPSGNLAFSAPTYPDGTMQLFEVDLETGDLTFKRTFYYGTRERRGLLGGPVVTWIDDRWALGGSAQYLLHASSPEEVEELIPPGMWLFDSWSETGEGIQIAEWCGGPLDGSEFPAETQCEGIIAGFNQAELVYHPSTDQLFLVVAEEDGWTKAIAWISEEGDADCEDEVEEEREKGDRGFMGEVRDCKSNKKRRKGSYAVWEVPLNVSLSTNNGVSPVEGNDPFYSFTNLRFVKRFWAGSDGYPENWHSSHLMTLIDTGVDLGSNGDAEKKKGGVKNPFDGVLGDFEKAWNEKLETEKGAESPQTLEENSSEVLLVIESVLSAIILEIDPETFSLVAYSDEIESGFLMPHSLQTDWRRKQQSWNTWLGCWPQSKCPSVMNGTS
uniref:Uncharacterized protein n=1 Tax=Chromera velia CCMP2878 TaxID=1169474 RepID=A0A0G4IDF0_9ALVE|eukprot:Cvel_13413.t1-p1 / transcript=Cvel_13413.t1 / gene=Cvel_13413 / organism=Chromera_velia_CCMP2878 / gene_product=hypothetical protein / transcript_product=hypothetical protein / location=Cvel_scaffold914:47318-51280(-) / protein_length=522 / sequence_SO=supercontig / SO=protein_coding / is_pseudo=false